jgi:hypothetical protein
MNLGQFDFQNLMQMLYYLNHGDLTVETCRGRPFQCQAVEVAAQTLVEERRQMDFVKLKLSVYVCKGGPR